MRAGWCLGIAVGLASVACAGQKEPLATPSARPGGPLPEGGAQVCVLRPDTLFSDVSMSIRDNGRLVGATRGATYVCWIAATGEHQITSASDDTGPTLLHARAGARYWLHQEVTEVVGAVHAHLDAVDDRAASELLEGCDERVRVAVPGHDDEAGAMRIAPAKARR